MRSSNGRAVIGKLVQDPETGYWREEVERPVPPEDPRAPERERRYRNGLSEAAGEVVLRSIHHNLSSGRRRIFVLPAGSGETRIGTCADMVSHLVLLGLLFRGEREEGSAAWVAEDDALQGRVNLYLVGHGFRVRERPRCLGVGNKSLNRTRFKAMPMAELQL